ncbi:translation initiation factor IF-2-like [Rhinolophus ferrumequinum]|uniref:translation initiation factor IF-2-like n=1 Tax=Rhinolophus ferrumequinum TaxID=59479 RepID=UPI00140FFCBF|nr:translation initiation factor IF-2-like [Rhinolophus ferrumequinum]XP_032951430.1 translation initiation factor IF-2-like [Rhinolophus ferrumequinum]XP_032951431.1 translation initiation factor IF-2-like [Rhinolophus ferrumequinum]XP_032951432.1 translation initiation factor IF-2-like [Rhinolophus ferrumequinum]
MMLVLGRLERADCSGGERTPRPRSGGRLAVPPRPVSARRPPPHPAPCQSLRRSSASDLGQEGGGDCCPRRRWVRNLRVGGWERRRRPPHSGRAWKRRQPLPHPNPAAHRAVALFNQNRWHRVAEGGPRAAAARGGGSGEVRAPLSPVPARVPLPVLSQHPLPGAPFVQGEPGAPPVLGWGSHKGSHPLPCPPQRRGPTRVCGRRTRQGTLSTPASAPTQGHGPRPYPGSHPAAVTPGPIRCRPKGQCDPAPNVPTPGAPQVTGPAQRPTPSRPEPQSQALGHGVAPTRGCEPRRLRVRPCRALSPCSARDRRWENRVFGQPQP